MGGMSAGATADDVRETAAGEVRDVDVVILGGGLCGMAVAIALGRAGIDDVVIVERAPKFGGTWTHNRYPGCAVDIPSHVYSYSFALRADWSRVFAPQPELEAYLDGVAADFGLHAKLAANTEVLEASWDEGAQRWLVRTTGRTYRARAYVSAAGPLHEPIIPDLPGRGKFSGEMFHSAHWPEHADLAGKRVVVIGTGASAIQFVPAIAPVVAHMTVLQRTPSWVLPKMDWRVSRLERRLLRAFPPLRRLARLAIWGPMDAGMVLALHRRWMAGVLAAFGRFNIRRAIADRDLRRSLTPDYATTCKRLGLSNDFYPALARPNVELVTSPAAEIRERSVVTADGREIDADVIILGTGFRTLQHHPANERIRGRDGRTLAEVWRGCPTAYLGTTVHGFPNAFVMFGPNVGTLSGFVMAEAQAGYVVGAVRALLDGGVGSIDVRQEAQDAFVREVDERMVGTTFLSGCSSYYLDDSGRVALAWPWSMARLRRRLAHFDISAYEVRAAVAEAAPAPA